MNRSTKELTDAKKSLLERGSSFIPDPTNVNWFNLERDFDNFVNKLCCMAFKQNDKNKKNGDRPS